MKRVLIRAVVSVAILTALFVFLPWVDVRTAVARLPLAVWVTVLIGFLAGHSLGVVKWRLLVNAGRSALSAIDAIRCYAAGLFANMCLPSIIGGDVLRAVLAGKATGRPEAVVLGGISDRLIDLCSAGILVLVGGLLSRGMLPGWGTQLVTVGVALAAIGVLVLPVVLRRPLRAWPQRMRRPVGRALVALRASMRTPSTAIMALVISLTIQTSFVALNGWIGRSIGVDVPFAAWLLAWSLAKVVGLLPISLGGLGVRDATLGALLAPFGVPVALGVVASLIWQSVLIVGGLAAGSVWWLLGRRIQTRAAARSRLIPVSSA